MSGKGKKALKSSMNTMTKAMEIMVTGTAKVMEKTIVVDMVPSTKKEVMHLLLMPLKGTHPQPTVRKKGMELLMTPTENLLTKSD